MYRFSLFFESCLALLMLASCSDKPLNAKRSSPPAACQNLPLQESEWTPSGARETVGCLVRVSAYQQQILAMDASQFRQTALWLNQIKKQSHEGHGNLLKMLQNAETLSADTAPLFRHPLLFELIADPRLAPLSPLLFAMKDLWAQPADSRLALRDLVSSFKTFQNLNWSLGDWVSFSQNMKGFLQQLRFANPSARSELLSQASRLLKSWGSDLGAQRALSLLARDVKCQVPQINVQTRSPLPLSLEIFAEDREHPDRFAGSFTQAFVLWKELCRPADDFRMPDLSSLLKILLSDYGRYQNLVQNVKLQSALGPLGSLMQLSVRSGADSQKNLIALLAQTPLFDRFLRWLDNDQHWAAFLRQFPDDETLETFVLTLQSHSSSVDSLKTSQGAYEFLAVLSPLANNSALVGEWQSLIAALGPQSLQDLAGALEGGAFVEALQSLRWMLGIPNGKAGPSPILPTLAPAWKQSSWQPLEAKVSARMSGLQSKLDQCLSAAASSAQILLCWQAMPASSQVLLNKIPAIIEDFRRQWPVVEELRAAPWNTFFANTPGYLKALHPDDDDVRYLLSKVDDELFSSKSFKQALNDGVIERLLQAIDQRSPYAAQINALKKLAQKRFQFSLHVPDAKGSMLSKKFSMNGLEVLDRLFWELKLPLVGSTFTIHQFIRSWMTLDTADQVPDWLSSKTFLMQATLRLARIFSSKDSSQVLGFENGLVLMNIIKNEFDPADFLEASRFLRVLAATSDSQLSSSGSELIILLHQMGVLKGMAQVLEQNPVWLKQARWSYPSGGTALSHWLRDRSPQEWTFWVRSQIHTEGQITRWALDFTLPWILGSKPPSLASVQTLAQFLEKQKDWILKEAAGKENQVLGWVRQVFESPMLPRLYLWASLLEPASDTLNADVSRSPHSP